MTDWTTDANDALHISLVRAPEDKQSLAEGESYEDFHPTFTYPIYGEEEKIYGYKDLSIQLKFASGSLAQLLTVNHAGKISASSSTVDNAKGKLEKFILSGLCADEADFTAQVEKDAESFTPIGTKIYSYTRQSPLVSGKGKGTAPPPADSDDVVDFEVYHATWATPGFRDYHRRMQLFVLLYIEGSSYIIEDEEGWEFALLYEKRKRRGAPNVTTYHFVGYSSLYPFYYFPEKTRLRLSQFVILPPYQRNGHGSALYTAIYEHILARPDIAELTVEDPAEAFEDLRDVVDLRMLLAHAEFMAEAFGAPTGGGGGPVRTKPAHAKAKGKIGPPVERGWAERWRARLKIAGRQYQRLLEMLQILHLNPNDARAQRAYRLQVKERLYRFNYDALVHLEKEDRLTKLEETFQNVQEGYRRTIAPLR